MPSTLIVNAHVVNENSTRELDVLIQDGRIAKIGPDLSAQKADKVIDAKGKYLMPGMIDDQVHFREPGLTHKGDIGTESRAAVAGGITSFMEMPNVKPITDNLQALEDKYQRAAQKSVANFAFYLGATNKNLETIKRLPYNVACGVKIFMGASTGDMLVNDPDVLDGIFQYCPILIATHCEDTPTIDANLAEAVKKYGDQIPLSEHPNIRSAEACYMSSDLAIRLAKKHGANLHVLHLTTAKEMAHFAPGPIEGKHITAEACVHHLFFNSNDYADLGNQIKCNPAIKTTADQIAILQAVKEDRIDIIATDHAPHTWQEKQNPSYVKAPAGLPLVQHALLSLLEQVHLKRFTLEMVVKKVCHNPAIRYKVKERGFIREGYWADLVLVDLADTTTVTKESLLYKCGWSPFEGKTLHGKIAGTWVNGHHVFDGQSLAADLPHGERLAFEQHL